MADVTQLLDAAAAGDPRAAEVLLPLVYDELRKLAAARLAAEKPGQTLQPTALVHDAYLRLVGEAAPHDWNGRGHFFGAAAEAMRRILVERSRHKGRIRHGGDVRRVDLLDAEVAAPVEDERILLLDESLGSLAVARPQAAELVKLHFFAGLTLEEVAPILAMSPRTARRLWAFARAWLRRDMDRSDGVRLSGGRGRYFLEHFLAAFSVPRRTVPQGTSGATLHQAGDSPVTESHMPEESLFAQALEIASAAERAAFLDRACGENPTLRAEVEALLRAHDQSGDLLDLPDKLPLTTDLPARERPGTLIGPYKLLEQIGEGGMGTVWMAEQTEPIRRRVAVKVIKEGMDSGHVLARFEAERQALALMEHPNIAKVLDAGRTPSGRPYFVMELVKGQPITTYCDEKRLGVRQRLELFADACRAVQHAHQKGIIHRDIKPSNVLVAPYDGRLVVKVIDFGVAKATGPRLTDKTLFTEFGALVGTPEYMSPEQAETNNQDIDTRSDIYSLGVLLYELLTGSTPLTRKRVREVALLEVLRVIREEEPPRPSTRLSDSKASLPSISAQRQTEPARLTKLVRGELDWIVMKALEKERTRRYETANGFAMDVQRYLADEPVQACPQSTVYKLRKFARRNKTAMVVAFLVLFFIVLLGSGGGWVAYDRAARRTTASQNLELALQRAELYLGQGNRGDALVRLDQADQLASEARPDLAQQERMTELRRSLEAAEQDQQFVVGFENVLLNVETKVDVVKGRFTTEATFPAIHQLFRQYGISLVDTPLYEAAARIRNRPAPVCQQLLAAVYDCGRHVPEEDVRTLDWLQGLLEAADTDPWRRKIQKATVARDWDQVEQLVRTVDVSTQPPALLVQFGGVIPVERKGVRLDFLRRVQRAYPGDLWANHDLAMELVEFGRFDEAIRFFTAALALRPDNPGMYLNRGRCLDDMNETDEAIADYERCLALAPNYFTAFANLSIALQKQGRLQDALAVCNKAVQVIPDRAGAWSNRANIYNKLGRHKEAIADCNAAIQRDEKLAAAWANRGAAHRSLGEYEEALADCTKAIEMDGKSASALAERGNTYLQQGEYGKALADCTRSIELNPTSAFARYTRGAVHLAMNDPENALADCQKAVELAPRNSWTHGNLGDVLLSVNRAQDAAAAYRRAIEIDGKVAEFRVGLALALEQQGEFRKALASMRNGHDLRPKESDEWRRSAQWVQRLERLVELEERLPSLISGQTKAASPEERIEVAEICVRKQLNRAAVRFYDDAFTPLSPRTAPLIGAYRYNAACAAALAGCGRGKDADKLDDQERSQLRKKSLDWMRGSLETVGRLSSRMPERVPEMARAVKHWLADPDFEGVRGPEALTKLPEAEQQQWNKLWNDMADALKRAEEKATPEKRVGGK